MKGLTPRQREVLDFLKTRLADGLIPTRAEIAKEMGFKSANASEEHLRALHKKGYIKLIPHISRGIKILRFAQNPQIM